MRTGLIFCVWAFAISALIFFVGFNKNRTTPAGIQPALSAAQWHDSLFQHLPKGIDTSIMVEDMHGVSLRFSQYVKPIFNNEAIVYHDKGKWKLQRTTKSAYDSLANEDFGISRVPRAMAYRMSDTITSWQKKLNNIAHTLSQADYVLVLKNQRKLFIKRKGQILATFTIDLGFKPVGDKVSDGDGKTPEGIYHLDNEYNRDDKLYRSFWISYPNDEDKAIAKSRGVKPGVGILIHGTTAGKINATDWTAGCIALQNKDMDILFDLVEPGTIIEIRK